MSLRTSWLLHAVLLATGLVSLTSPADAQPARSNGRGGSLLQPVEPGLEEFEERENTRCADDFRTFDGTCNNKQQKLWGSAGLPHFSYFPPRRSTHPTGSSLPSPRFISNVLSKQTGDIFNARGISEMFVFFGQFVDHTFAATPVETTDHFPIPIPTDDPIFANFSDGTLPFERSRRGMSESDNVEHPINSLTSFLDLTSVYGSDDLRIKSLRSFKYGRMLTSAGNLLPINTEGLRNAPTNDNSFFAAGDHRANEHPMLTSIHTIFLREHNSIADELRQKFPDWDDETIFQNARKINGAQFQKIVYEEFIPTLTGRGTWTYRGYKKHVNPTLSDEFATAAFRIGHTMVGNQINRAGMGNIPMSPLPMTAMFFRPLDVMKDGIEPFIRGALINRCQEVDVHVHNSLRNFLFTGIPQERGFDLIALNLQRGRDHGLPTYNEIRVIFRREPAWTFSQMTRKKSLQSALATVYKTPDRVEAWIGLMAEDHVRGASMGRTLLRMWRREFHRLREGDRFFYKRPGLFSKEVWDRMPRVRDIFFQKETMRAILLRNTQVTDAEIGTSVWKVDGVTNSPQQVASYGASNEANGHNRVDGADGADGTDGY